MWHQWMQKWFSKDLIPVDTDRSELTHKAIRWCRRSEIITLSPIFFSFLRLMRRWWRLSRGLCLQSRRRGVSVGRRKRQRGRHWRDESSSTRDWNRCDHDLLSLLYHVIEISSYWNYQYVSLCTANYTCTHAEVEHVLQYMPTEHLSFSTCAVKNTCGPGHDLWYI